MVYIYLGDTGTNRCQLDDEYMLQKKVKRETRKTSLKDDETDHSSDGANSASNGRVKKEDVEKSTSTPTLSCII